MTPAHSGALAPARNVHARDSSSPVVRNVRRPSRWYAACATVSSADSPRPYVSRISARSSGAHAAISASMSIGHRERAGGKRRRRSRAPRRCWRRSSNGLVVSRNTGARRASSSAESAPRRIGVPSESAACACSSDVDLGHDLLVAALRGAALACRAAARRWRGRRARARARARADRLRDRARPARRRTRAARSGSRRSCAASPRNLAPRPSPGFDAGRQREVHELEARGHDLLRLRHRREPVEPLVGHRRDADRRLVLARRGEPGRARRTGGSRPHR